MSRDFGDFQTPHLLVDEVITCLFCKGKQWTRVLEPTCGQGNFIKGLLATGAPVKEIQGIEIQDKYISSIQELTQTKQPPGIVIQHASIFDLHLQRDVQWKEHGPLLVLGNPPWVTNAALSTLGSSNVPEKVNIKGLSGFGARTGESNFDIAEYIWLKLATELVLENPTIALLCKTSVARNVLSFAYKTHIPVKEACLWHINSRESFGAAVDACLFYLDIEAGSSSYHAPVYSCLNATEPYTTMGIVNHQLVPNIVTNRNMAFVDNVCPLTWRQGLKHDAASVFELRYDSSGHLYNKLNEIVHVEPEYIYPLLKSSDLGGKEKQRSQKAVVVTQKRIGENTHHLREHAPLLWKYLLAHHTFCDSRKSSVYDKQPPFAIFGIGDYSFSPYKVAISGMYKTARFSAIAPVKGRPVQFDDTCYFLPCESAEQASLISSLLNHPICIECIHSIVFWDAKRPITKKLLQRINLKALLKLVDKEVLLEQANRVLHALEPAHHTHSGHWPENVEDLLEDSFATSNMRDSATSVKEEKIIQIHFL
jgi:hypothetical protein